jgi:hypothetical protein
VKQHSVVSRHDEGGGAIATHRSWRQGLIRNWDTIEWTAQGGSLESLRNLLAMHSLSVSLAMAALQTGSTTRIEGLIPPIADQVGTIYGRSTGNLDRKIEDARAALLSLQAGLQASPADSPRSPPMSPSRFQGSRTGSIRARTTAPRELDEVSPTDPHPGALSPSPGASPIERRRQSGEGLPASETISPQRSPRPADMERRASNIFSISSNESQSPRASASDMPYMLPRPAINSTGATSPDLDPEIIAESSALQPETMIEPDHAHALTPAEHKRFERALFTNAATLCSV